ncbi:MAG: FAD-binding protein [Coriobacteriales bacterium]|nr:FAD-binding protein [Coriobacteriales bacterium]
MSNSSNPVSITRRTLLAGGAAVASAAALMSAAAFAEEAPAPAGDYKAAPAPIEDSEVAETVEVDVVVVGLGNAGTVAAVTAAEMGAKVLAFQKADTPYTFGTGVAWPNTTALEASGVHNEPWEIVNTIQRDLNQNHGKTCMWRNWVNYGEEVGNWWCAFMDADPELGPSFGMASTPPDDDNLFNFSYSATHVGWGSLAMPGQPFYFIVNAMMKKALEDGADIDARYNTPAVQLKVEDGKVVGAYGKAPDGSIILALASKGVILCTGGYSHNQAMRDEYMPIWNKMPSSQIGGGEDGDGILMGYWAGGRIEDAPHCAAVHYDPPVDVPNYFGAVVPWLRVNLNGERFSNEDMSYAYMPFQDVLQPEGVHFQVFDNNYAEDSLHMGQGSLFGDWATMVPTALEAGDLYTGETLEELAQDMGVPVDVFVATVERYNEMCAAGYDKDFGKQASRLKPIVKPPFYAFKRHASVLCTMSGLEVTENYEVLTPEGKVIPGLWAAGNDSGCMFGGTQYPLNMPGISIGRAMLSGRVAAWRVCGRVD